ncbi:MAG: AAA family ATPase [Deltaproteobacteria bacterium]|nr:AAA family ATPase [Deltaproteobacteria bacterium]
MSRIKTQSKPQTLGDLKNEGYVCRTVREEMRANLIAAMETGGDIFPGIIGYEETVLPQLENAVLSGHDVILLGERGQAKTRLIRSLVNLLDEEIPVIRGSEVNDSPLAPISRLGKELLAKNGDALEIEWIKRQERYAEKLATPDTTAAELIGEIDPIKVAEGRYLSDELTIHFGLVPRANRGIFAINELPDLSEKVQVSLFNILQERDLQIKGYKLRLPLDVLVVATANPEDYTSRGRIITPLKDRYSAHIRTHYPLNRRLEKRIIDQEVPQQQRHGRPVRVTGFMKDILAELTMQARLSSDINQTSGVSVRMSISNMESMISSAEKRAIRCGEPEIVPRISDLAAVVSTTDGKLELEYAVTEETPALIVEKLTRRAVERVFAEYLLTGEKGWQKLEPLVTGFNDGSWVEVSALAPARDYVPLVGRLKGLKPALEVLELGESAGELAAAVEFLLEGLHVNRKISREVVEGRTIYNETNKIQQVEGASDLA